MSKGPVVDLTPSRFRRCAIGACPALFETADGTYLIVGRLAPRGAVPPERIGSGEVAIEVPAELLRDFAGGRGDS